MQNIDSSCQLFVNDSVTFLWKVKSENLSNTAGEHKSEASPEVPPFSCGDAFIGLGVDNTSP